MAVPTLWLPWQEDVSCGSQRFPGNTVAIVAMVNASTKERKTMKHGIVVLLALVLGTSTLAFSATEDANQKKKPEAKPAAGQKASQKVKDPVCGMEIDTKEAAGKSTYKGKTYHFCSVSEKEQFDKDPAKYVK